MEMKDSPLKLDGDLFLKQSVEGKERAIKIETILRGTDANVLISLVNLANDDASYETLIERIIHFGLLEMSKHAIKAKLGISL